MNVNSLNFKASIQVCPYMFNLCFYMPYMWSTNVTKVFSGKNAYVAQLTLEGAVSPNELLQIY